MIIMVIPPLLLLLLLIITTGVDPEFLEHGGANFFYKLISTVWHFNGRIFMLQSFPVFFESEFLGG